MDDTGALICKALGLRVGNNLVSRLASKKERNPLIVSGSGGEKWCQVCKSAYVEI